LSQLNQESILHVPLADSFKVDEIYEMSVSVRVKTFQMDQYLLSEAELFYGESISLAYEAVQIAVLSKAKYLKHLPEIYERDDFVSHFLMLIESFWKPISQQIEQMNAYFDPVLTSPVVLPWLASWVGLSVDKSLPLERVRALLKSAMIFYQQRGTLQALVAYLETFTGGEVHVLERRARNFILGKQCNLGVEIALGKENQPNSLLIEVAVPPEEIIALKLSNDMYQRKINDIVRSLVPAHTIFDVHCEFR
jgi:phage tail-like protein